MADSSSDLTQLLGLHPSSPILTSFVASLASAVANPRAASPEIKSYPDVVYFNYFPLGLSLLFKPINSYKPRTGLSRGDLNDGDLVVDGIDIYNVPKPSPGGASKSKLQYTSYPISPLNIALSRAPAGDDLNPRPTLISIAPDTTGKAFVETMGEPDRKGGGAGPSSGSIAIWCEWSKDGVMVEFGGDESRGPQAWERGKDAIWKIISVFPPKDI